LKPLIELIEGDSASPQVASAVRQQLRQGERVLVFLDAKHTKAHVLAELENYAPLVSVGSYIVAMDGIMGQLGPAPRTQPSWATDNPREAALEFVRRHSEFVIEEPAFQFNEGMVNNWVTYWPGGFLKRIR
jgi:cephalosporin hydroxylase